MVLIFNVDNNLPNPLAAKLDNIFNHVVTFTICPYYSKLCYHICREIVRFSVAFNEP